MAGWDKAKALAHLNQYARPKSVGLCARYTREAIEAGGLTLERTRFAKDYGASLEGAGFKQLPFCPVAFLSGDVVVIDGFAGATEGHMAMFNGVQWVSDFRQSALYPGAGYRQNQPKYMIYRRSDD